MTREEQINEACDKEVFRILCDEPDLDLYDEEVALGKAFIAGAEWADKHPCWISIYEREPDNDCILGAFYQTDFKKIFFKQTTREEIEAKSTTLTKCVAWMQLPEYMFLL